MKVVVLLPLLFATSRARPADYENYDEMLLPLDPQQEQCIAELNLDREMVAYLSTQEFPPEDDPTCNEFFACSWKKHGYQYDNGQINYGALEKITLEALFEQAGSSSSAISLAEMLAKTSVNDCRNVGGISHGQTAIKVHNCIYRRLRQLAKEQRNIKYTSNKESTCLVGADFVNVELQNKKKCIIKGFL